MGDDRAARGTGQLIFVSALTDPVFYQVSLLARGEVLTDAGLTPGDPP
jgi:hypothetical protein